MPLWCEICEVPPAGLPAIDDTVAYAPRHLAGLGKSCDSPCSGDLAGLSLVQPSVYKPRRCSSLHCNEHLRMPAKCFSPVASAA